MGFFSTCLGDNYNNSNKISNSARKHVAPQDRQILSVVRPAGQLCRFFGVFPFTFTTSSLGDTLYLEFHKRFWFLTSLTIFLLIVTPYMIFQIGSFVHCLGTRSILELTAQSIWIICALPPYFLSIFMLVQGKSIVKLFEEWAIIERDLERLFCPIMTRIQVIRFQRIYGMMTILSMVLVGYHALQRPTVPVYPFYYFETFNQTAHLSWVAFQLLIMAWIWAGLAILEGICCLFATVVSQCMSTLEIGISVTFNNKAGKSQNKYVEQPLGEPTMTPQNHEEFMQTAVHHILMRCSRERENNEPSATPTPDGGGTDQGPFKSDASLEKIKKDDYLLFVVRKLQTVGLLQGRVNRILGPLLLLDVAQLVILTCVMLFLPIRFSHKFEGFEIAVTFLGNGAAVLVRLILFVVCLGKVYSKGQEVNVALAQALISAKLETSYQNPVLAHLCVFSSNPITFTAWDFFPITRGTLLASFSLISTYAIVFLQINV